MTFPSTEKKQSLHDAMVAYLREQPRGTSSCELAALFLKFKNPGQKFAAAAIGGILATDNRCFTDKSDLWFARAPLSPDTLPFEHLRELPWSALYCLSDPAERRLLYCALWDLRPSPSRVLDGWLVDPALIPEDERDVPAVSFNAAGPQVLLKKIVESGHNRILVFCSSRDRALLSAACTDAGVVLPDDTVLVSDCAKAAGISLARPLSFASLERAVLGVEAGHDMSGNKQAERFATCVDELIELLCRKGLETRSDLDRALQSDRSHYFSGKAFTYDDILALPAAPGVYGFKDANGVFLYIGKSSNLRRRLLSYFADTDESPRKRDRLQSESHTFVTHPCGSELESLIYEYRLLKKHTPVLAAKTGINERRGAFKPIHDSIILLPHVEAGKGMSLWFREGRKIKLRPFAPDFPVEDPLKEELQSFFFCEKLPAETSDFPEIEIATRWIKQAGDSLPVVPVARMADVEELYNALRIAWRDHQELVSAPI
jgi:hypothetical protein